MSTPSRSAVSFAVASGRTLNPMIIAFDAEARLTSDSLIAPTPPWMILTTTSSFESFSRLCLIASTDPCTSAFTTIPSSFKLPSWICVNRSSRESLDFVSSRSFTLLCEINVSAKFLAYFSFPHPTITSPAFGTSFSPRISTGVDGPASLTLLPLSSIMALTLPNAEPAAIGSPTRSVPF